MKVPVGIVDSNFGGSLPSLEFEYFYWRNGHLDSEVVVFTDDSIFDVDSYNTKVKIAWLLEPPAFVRELKSYTFYDYIKDNHHKFDMIFTYDASMLKINDKFRYVPFGTSWIHPNEQQIYKKSKNISIIASDKKITRGHHLRHQIIKDHRSKFDSIMGRGYKKFENKLDGLKDFRYSVVIENDNVDLFFTEKLIDCFMTGTIPIYWGPRSISKVFNADGIYCFNSSDDIENLLGIATEDQYLSRMYAIQENFETAKKFLRPEMIMWKNGLKDFFS